MIEIMFPNVSLDLDAVVLDYHSDLRAKIEQMAPGKFLPEVFTTNKDLQNLDPEFKVLKTQYLDNPKYLEEAPIIPGVDMAVARLADKARLHINTGRIDGLESSIAAFLDRHKIRQYVKGGIYTRSLTLVQDVRTNYIDFDDQIISKIFNALKAGARIGIDDYAKTCRAFGNNNIFAILISQPGNLGVAERPMVKRCLDLINVADQVERYGSFYNLIAEHKSSFEKPAQELGVSETVAVAIPTFLLRLT